MTSTIAAKAPARPLKADARLIIVDGEIGGGKSTLTEGLRAELTARGLRVCLVPEPVSQWEENGILKKFYANRARYAYEFQTFVFATRVLALQGAVAAMPDADVYICERAPPTDMIFMELQRDLLDKPTMAMYSAWCDAYMHIVPFDLSRATVLYLRTSLETCMARHRARARDGEVAESATAEPAAAESAAAVVAESGTTAAPEAPRKSGLTVEYQTDLRKAHEAFLLGEHEGAFPLMPRSVYPRDRVVLVPAEIADLNWRDDGAEKTAAIAAVLKLAGFADDKRNSDAAAPAPAASSCVVV